MTVNFRNFHTVLQLHSVEITEIYFHTFLTESLFVEIFVVRVKFSIFHNVYSQFHETSVIFNDFFSFFSLIIPELNLFLGYYENEKVVHTNNHYLLFQVQLFRQFIAEQN